jgi:hypothetical protein
MEGITFGSKALGRHLTLAPVCTPPTFELVMGAGAVARCLAVMGRQGFEPRIIKQLVQSAFVHSGGTVPIEERS